MNSRYIMASTACTIPLPETLAVCPYCQRALVATFDYFEKADDGEGWQAESVRLDCVGEPDLEADQWEAWIDWHSEMPYVHWLPLEHTVLQWVNRRYRFAVESIEEVKR